MANAGYCINDGTTGRPLFGRIKYNVGYMAYTDINDPFTFEDDLETTLHEIAHILGFSGYAIYNWRNPETGEPYA